MLLPDISAFKALDNHTVEYSCYFMKRFMLTCSIASIKLPVEGGWNTPSVVERDNAEIYCFEMRLWGFTGIRFFARYQVSIS